VRSHRWDHATFSIHPVVQDHLTLMSWIAGQSRSRIVSEMIETLWLHAVKDHPTEYGKLMASFYFLERSCESLNRRIRHFDLLYADYRAGGGDTVGFTNSKETVNKMFGRRSTSVPAGCYCQKCGRTAGEDHLGYAELILFELYIDSQRALHEVMDKLDHLREAEAVGACVENYS